MNRFKLEVYKIYGSRPPYFFIGGFYCLKNKHKLRDEKVSLIKLPLVKYELGRLENSRVNHEALIMIDSNYYSVPDSYVGKNVYSNVYLEHINVYNLNIKYMEVKTTLYIIWR